MGNRLVRMFVEFQELLKAFFDNKDNVFFILFVLVVYGVVFYVRKGCVYLFNKRDGLIVDFIKQLNSSIKSIEETGKRTSQAIERQDKHLEKMSEKMGEFIDLSSSSLSLNAMTPHQGKGGQKSPFYC